MSDAKVELVEFLTNLPTMERFKQIKIEMAKVNQEDNNKKFEKRVIRAETLAKDDPYERACEETEDTPGASSSTDQRPRINAIWVSKVELEKEEVDEATEYITECMKWRPKWAETLPLSCEIGHGDSYGEC
jgi:hypothetical protein